MSIMIDKSKCIGCGKCCMVCPGSLIKKDGDNKAFIGGMGSKVHTEENGDILKWVIEKYDGTVSEIDIDRKESNKY